ncbi:MAG: anthranilate phosphoribosyltransferase [Candidatus Marsarchaeota archaeon]|jgi:anthranilate phosphoribosyltransferase|nr:anthranilate phosphoribosyltransferase [Candidatus Marsarchaeota archaeon]
MNDFSEILKKLTERKDLEESEAGFALQEIMEGKVSSVRIAALLASLKTKVESVGELVAFARTMNRNGIKISPRVNNLVDTAGTGGDGMGTFNISTCAAFVAAGAGASMAKHGNRAASSKSGSADVLEELGASLITDPKAAQQQLEEIGITFLFAPSFSPAMRHVAPVRKELGFKTIFNLLGPLTNPANAKRQLIGVYDKAFLGKMAEALMVLGTERSLVVGSDLDEISISGETEVYEVSGNTVDNYSISPEDFGLKRSPIAKIRADGRRESARMILRVLRGEGGAAGDVTVLNAGAAIYASGLAKSIGDGVSAAAESIDSGRALEKLYLFRDYDGHS